MKLPSFSIFVAVVLSVLALARVGRADVGSVIVVVHSDSPEVPAEEVRQAIAAELGSPVTSAEHATPAELTGARGTVVVTYRAHLRQLAVTWQDAAHGSVTRVVDAPSRPAAILRTAAHLTGELSRNELGLQSAAVPPPQAAPAPAPTTESAASPAPAVPRPSPPAAPTSAPAAPREPPYAWANVGFVYPLATNFGHPDLRTHLDLALPASRIGTLSGFGFGVVEVADRVHGMQLGIVNVAGQIEGVQLGVVNIDGDVDGLPLGLVSVSREGGVHPLAWFDTLTDVNAGVKFATRSTYTILAAAGHFDDSRDFAGGSFTAGGTVHFGHLALDIDAGYTYLRDVSDRADGNQEVRIVDEHLERLRASVSFAIFPRLQPFAGAGLTVRERVNKEGDVADTAARPDFFGGVEW